MKSKIRIIFDMEFDSEKETGNVRTEVRFELPAHPEIACPEEIKAIVVKEISVVSAAMCTVPDLFAQPA